MREKIENRINELATLYSVTPSSTYIVEAYKLFNELYKKKYTYIANEEVKNYDPAQVQAELEDVLLKSMETYCPTSGIPFMPYLRTNLNRRILDLIKGMKTRRKHHLNHTMKDDNNEDVDPLLLVSDPNTVEDVVLRKMSPLVEYFKDNAMDPITLAIIETLTDENEITTTRKDVARKLGIHHETVNRKLLKLRKLFDSELFGDYKQYLAG